MTYYDNIGVGLNGCILILWFIIYFIVLCNYSYIYSEILFYDSCFSRKVFNVNMMFSSFLYFIIM